MQTLNWIVLALFLPTAAFGIVNAVRWAHAGGQPTRKIAIHASLQGVSASLWLAFTLTQLVWLAWTTFAVIFVAMVFGDRLMFASYKARNPGSVRAGYNSSYFTVAGDVLSFRRPPAALHAIVGAFVFFGMLVACVLATVAA